MHKRTWIVVVALLLVLALVGGGVVSAAPAWTKMRALWVSVLAVFDGPVTMSSTLDVDDEATFAGPVTMDDVTVTGTATYHATGVAIADTGQFTTSLNTDGILTAQGGAVVTGQASATAGVVGNTGTFTTTLKSGGQGNFNGGSVTVGQASATGAVVANSGTFTATLSVGTWETLVKQATITVTAGGPIAPTGTYQPITADGAVGTSNITVPAAGRLLILHNVGAQTITITDTGVIKLSADAVLTADDMLGLLSDGTNLNQLFVSNN